MHIHYFSLYSICFSHKCLRFPAGQWSVFGWFFLGSMAFFLDCHTVTFWRTSGCFYKMDHKSFQNINDLFTLWILDFILITFVPASGLWSLESKLAPNSAVVSFSLIGKWAWYKLLYYLENSCFCSGVLELPRAISAAADSLFMSMFLMLTQHPLQQALVSMASQALFFQSH